jgi:SAM-dependent methyltransferase
MTYKNIINTIEITRKFIYMHIKEGKVVLDCTVGNGNDTILLAKLVGDKGKVYGFDIQRKAIEITKQRLIDEELLDRVVLIEDGHENIDSYIEEKLDFVIYNLGYLPKGDKNIKTNPSTTLVSIEKSLDLLKENGLLLITCYVGHEGGMEEKNSVEEFLSKLNQKEFNVLKYDFINQINSPPVLYGVEKSKLRRD